MSDSERYTAHEARLAVLESARVDLKNHLRDQDLALKEIYMAISNIHKKLNNGLSDTMKSVATTQAEMVHDVLKHKTYFKIFGWVGGALVAAGLSLGVTLLSGS